MNEDTKRLLIICVAVVGVMWAAALVGIQRAKSDEAVKVALIQRASAAKICDAYATWKESQGYTGEPLMRGVCD